MEKTFDDYLKASPSERRKMNMSEILGEERLAKTKEQMSLEEAAEMRAIEYAERGTPKDADGEIWRVGDVMIENRMSFTDGFIAGAKWQKSQMLKDAVEGEVRRTNNHKHTSVRYQAFYGTDRYFYGIADKQLKPGDKVRIIIVKAEEE